MKMAYNIKSSWNLMTPQQLNAMHTPEQRSEIARKAQRASVEKRRRNRALQLALTEMINRNNYNDVDPEQIAAIIKILSQWCIIRMKKGQGKQPRLNDESFTSIKRRIKRAQRGQY